MPALAVAWLPRIVEMAHPACVESDRRLAAFLLCDVFEFGTFGADAAGLAAAAAYAPALLALAADGPPPRRQAACYGLGKAAAALGDAFAPHAAAAAALLAGEMAARRAPDGGAAGSSSDDEGEGGAAGDPSEEGVADNAASALAALLTRGLAAEYANRWAAYLPLRFDPDEAAHCAGALRALLEARPSPIDGGAAVACLARSAVALAEGTGTTARNRGGAPPTSAPDLAAALAALQAGGDAAVLGGAWAALDGDAQQCLQALATFKAAA